MLSPLRLEPTPVVGADIPAEFVPTEVEVEATPQPLAPVSGLGALVDAFLGGYRAGGGDPAYEGQVLRMISCESGWNTDSGGYHYGLAQFAPGTWAAACCSPGADWRSPWEQGCAVASWMRQIPGRWGTTAGWPVCWWR